MRLATLRNNGAEEAWVLTESGFLPVKTLNAGQLNPWPVQMLALIESGRLDELAAYVIGSKIDHSAQAVPIASAEFAPLYRRPRKIWGIGLNYRDHAADLAEKSPTAEPASFMKPDTSIIGHSDTILLPKLSEKTTGEAELALIFGRTCRDVPRDQWRSVLAGFTTVIDMTAEDILRRNPRNLTQSKSFDTFFSFGPVLVTSDEIPDVESLLVQTIINGKVHAENVVRNMTFTPDFLVSYHSQIMTLLPGDVLSTGTPGAAPLSHGDKVECRIAGFETLINPVQDLKR